MKSTTSYLLTDTPRPSLKDLKLDAIWDGEEDEGGEGGGQHSLRPPARSHRRHQVRARPGQGPPAPEEAKTDDARELLETLTHMVEGRPELLEVCASLRVALFGWPTCECEEPAFSTSLGECEVPECLACGGRYAYSIGEGVYWTDPDNGECSGEYTIQSIEEPDSEGDYTVNLTNEAGSEVGAWHWEIRPLKGI